MKPDFTKQAILIFAFGILGLSMSSCSRAKPAITQEELVRRTQELMDSAATGNPTPWKKYFAEDSMIFDEKGRNMDKTALLKDVAPLPPGYSGTIKLVKSQSRIFSNTAVLSYDLDETETVFGQNMTARYHGTDTWMLRNGEWQIVASQMLRYYEDPAPGKADTKKYRDYTGAYELAPGKTMVVSTDGVNLYAQRGQGTKDLLIPEASDIFFRKGVEGRRLFHRDDNSRVDALIDRRNNEDIVWRKTK
jgi:Domain of unknown function (DUF4440)/Domain of unknown function (DUF3471)